MLFSDKSTIQKRIAGEGRKLTDADFDQTLADWVKTLRAQKLRVTRNMIFAEAVKLSSNYPKMIEFKVTYFSL